mgnify:FL=1
MAWFGVRIQSEFSNFEINLPQFRCFTRKTVLGSLQGISVSVEKYSKSIDIPENDIKDEMKENILL